MIELGDGLSLPDAAVTSAYALLGMKGSGKSNAAVVLAEEFYDAGLPWCCIDPKGDWWGVRAGLDGNSANGLAVPIFGGLHADVPIDPNAGGQMADLIVERHLTCLIDTSELSKGESIRFLRAFFERLYRLKNRATYPMHVFLEECDDYVPQKVYTEIAALVRAVEVVVKRGRTRGLGITLASQRSASVNKDVLSQTDTLIALRATDPRDRKAIKEWLTYNAGSQEIVDELPTLGDGEAWVSSPSYLRIRERVKFHRRRTFDSGATPELGEQVKAATLADIDVGAINAAFAEQIERAKADDPKALRGRIVMLEREVARLERDRPEPEIVEVPTVDRDTIEALNVAVSSVADAFADAVVPALSRLRIAVDAAVSASSHERSPAQVPARRGAPRERPPPDPAPFRAATAVAAADGDVVLKAGARRMLGALARVHPMRLTMSQIATLAKVKKTGGTFGTYWSILKGAGYLDVGPVDVGLTDAGLARAGVVERAPHTTDEIVAMYRDRLKAGARRMLDALVAAYPRTLDRDELAERAQIERTGGTFGTYLSTLTRNGLAEVTAEGVRAGEALYLG